MLKYDYFATLESLASKSAESVMLACKGEASKPQEIYALTKSCYSLTSELERSLFSEFLPPFDRESIAAYAHDLTSLSEAALIYYTTKTWSGPRAHTVRFEEICTELSSMILQSAKMMKKIKKTPSTPQSDRFRALKSQAFEMCLNIKRAKSAILSAKPSESELSLLSEISKAFEKSTEVMLKNI